MAGIYIHIPFCKQACHYCNFHFSTSLKYKKEMVDALVKEIAMQKDYLAGSVIESVYFGGGTPSLLDSGELDLLFNQIYKFHIVSPDAEISLEANPDDLTSDKLRQLASSPVNRLSIGIQSFSETDLLYMNRAHNVAEAHQAIRQAQQLGFRQLSIDLIYGTPGLSDAQWQQNLKTTFSYGIPHISSYCLTVESNTALDHFIRKGKSAAVDELQAARQFEMLMDITESQGYEHYEISNFSISGGYAVHNTNYWRGIPYLGIGPSAHSFDGQHIRQWNIANNALYMKAIQNDELPFEKEQLSEAERYNEYVMTSLRTMWGSELKKIEAFGDQFPVYFEQEAKNFLAQNLMVKMDSRFTLTRTGKLVADQIASDLFYEEG